MAGRGRCSRSTEVAGHRSPACHRLVWVDDLPVHGTSSRAGPIRGFDGGVLHGTPGDLRDPGHSGLCGRCRTSSECCGPAGRFHRRPLVGGHGPATESGRLPFRLRERDVGLRLGDEAPEPVRTGDHGGCPRAERGPQLPCPRRQGRGSIDPSRGPHRRGFFLDGVEREGLPELPVPVLDARSRVGVAVDRAREIIEVRHQAGRSTVGTTDHQEGHADRDDQRSIPDRQRLQSGPPRIPDMAGGDQVRFSPAP